MEELLGKPGEFVKLIEVVPPGGDDIQPLMNQLDSLSNLQFHGFSVATNPVAKARMSAMVTCHIIQQQIKRPAVLHCTTRDHNRISLQGELWGAKALGIKTIMAATGDRVAYADKNITSNVSDVDVFELIGMVRDTGFFTGVVFDTWPEVNGLSKAVDKLKRKVDAGAQYAVTQPVYDRAGAEEIHKATKDIGIPVVLGILPLRTPKHADFLHEKVSGIAVPEAVRKRMHEASDSINEGIVNAGEVFAVASELFAGACIMPPFDHFEVMPEIIK